MDDALENLARTLADGCIALIHSKACPLAEGGERCTCAAVLVGPAVRGMWQ